MAETLLYPVFGRQWLQCRNSTSDFNIDLIIADSEHAIVLQRTELYPNLTTPSTVITSC